MRAMNFETRKWRSGADAGGPVESEVIVVDDAAAARRRRRNIILGVLALAVLAIALFLLFGRGAAGKAGAGPGAATSGAAEAPAVSVIVPGRQQVARTISATGTLAARRDMPVGVAGEGGMISQVLVEPGQWVGA